LKGHGPDYTGKAPYNQFLAYYMIIGNGIKNIEGGCSDVSIDNSKCYKKAGPCDFV
jgi:hypothetical protein